MTLSSVRCGMLVVRITWVGVIVSAMLLACSVASGQTTRPVAPSLTSSPVQAGAGSSTAPAPWAAMMSQLSRALVGSVAENADAVADASDSAAAADTEKSPIETLVRDDVRIQCFGCPDLEARSRLVQQTSGLTVVAVRAYAWPAETVATDLSADIENSDVLPAEVRKEFTSRDEADAKRANATALQWIFSLLQPAPGQTVGVIVLWPTQPAIGVTTFGTSGNGGNAPPAEESTTQQPIFVLVKGTRTPESADGGKFTISQITYGDIRRALN